MPRRSPQLALSRICLMLALAALTVPLVAGRDSNPWEQTDWQQWTSKDIHKILSNSPWVSTCCRDFSGAPASSDGAGDLTASPGYISVLVSSRAVREALVRNVQLDKRYEKLDPARRREVDQKADACLNKKFDNFVVFGFSFLVNSKVGGKLGDKLAAISTAISNVSIATSDGRNIAGHLVPAPESISMACGAFAHDSYLASLGSLWSDLPSFSWPLGPGKELAFPRLVDGKPTIRPEDKTIRIHLDVKAIRDPHPANYYNIDFTIAKLIYQGKPDF
jgi:hypothetical protein